MENGPCSIDSPERDEQDESVEQAREQSSNTHWMAAP